MEKEGKQLNKERKIPKKNTTKPQIPHNEAGFCYTYQVLG